MSKTKYMIGPSSFDQSQLILLYTYTNEFDKQVQNTLKNFNQILYNTLKNLN